MGRRHVRWGCRGKLERSGDSAGGDCYRVETLYSETGHWGLTDAATPSKPWLSFQQNEKVKGKYTYIEDGRRIRYVKVPCPPPDVTGGSLELFSYLLSFNVFMGGDFFSTATKVHQARSGTPPTDDPVADNATTPTGGGFIAGGGGTLTLITTEIPGNLVQQGTGAAPLRYAPDDEALAYVARRRHPLETLPAPPRPRITIGVDANVYGFAGSTSTITGIPGGPFGTASGVDSFKFRDNVMFTLGGIITIPVAPGWSIAVTGGFADLNRTFTYNCVTYCAVPPATPGFSDSKDIWLGGGYIGARVQTGAAFLGLPRALVGFDYKHVFLGSQTVTLGNAGLARIVTLSAQPDLDLFMANLAFPLR
jgi:hypothetical protein